MTVDSKCTLRVERRFDASAERVFDAWLNPTTAAKWLFTAPGGEIVRAEIDPRVGGKFLFVDGRGVKDIEHVGEYLEINRPTRLVFTFAVPEFSPEYTRVTIDIVPVGAGCQLTLTHDGVLPEWESQTREGWGMILGQLADSLTENPTEHGTVIELGTVRFERLLPGPIERVWAYLTESDKRARWLASGELEPRVGGTAQFKFDHASLSTETAPPPERFKEGGCSVTHHNVTRYEPPRILALTWPGGPADELSEVTFELSSKGEQVLLVLTHRKLADRKTMVDVGAGWHTHLDMLVDRLNEREPAAFWTTFTRLEKEYEKRITD